VEDRREQRQYFQSREGAGGHRKLQKSVSRTSVKQALEVRESQPTGYQIDMSWYLIFAYNSNLDKQIQSLRCYRYTTPQ